MLALQQGAGNRATAGLVQGVLQPSTFAAGIAAVGTGAETVRQEVATTATTVAQGAGMPDAPPAQPLVEPPDPRLPRPAVPTLTAPAAASTGDAPIPASATATMLGQHGAQVDQIVAGAASQADAAAATVTVPAIAPTVAPVREPAPAPEAPPAMPVPAGPFPALKPNVARVLDTGFGGWLSRQAATAQTQTGQAVAQHGQQVDTASREHESSVDAAEAAAAAEIAAVRGGADTEVGSHRSAWRAENAGITSAARSEIATERTSATADVRREADQANASAQETVADAYRRAQAERSGPAVQGSWWSRVKGRPGGRGGDQRGLGRAVQRGQEHGQRRDQRGPQPDQSGLAGDRRPVRAVRRGGPRGGEPGR